MTAATRRVGRAVASADAGRARPKNGAAAEWVSSRANQTTPGIANVNKP
jgi:hypothetical protein